MHNHRCDSGQAEGGWEYEFVSELLEEYKCSICLKALREARQIAGCGHRFCAVCIERVLRTTPAHCPLDRSVIDKDQVFDDIACRNAILSKEVLCCNEGCSWIGQLRHAQEHRQTCLDERVPCWNRGCTQHLLREKLEHHRMHECQWRPTTCAYCKQQHPLCKGQEHLQTCGRYPVPCTNDCEQQEIPRAEMGAHIRDECPLTILTCDFSHLNCTFQDQRTKMSLHMETQAQDHLKLVLDRITNVNLRVTQLTQELGNCDTRRQEMRERLARLERAPNKEDGKLLWVISNYSQSLEDARRGVNRWLYSEPFFSGRYGYKLRACVSLYGDEEGYGTHLSVYIAVMRGKYDALLPWPFQQQVKFFLLDQEESYYDRRDFVIPIIPNSLLEGWNRPGTNVNPGVGVWKFFAHERLRPGRFLVDDTIFLKVEVASFDILSQQN